MENLLERLFKRRWSDVKLETEAIMRLREVSLNLFATIRIFDIQD